MKQFFYHLSTLFSGLIFGIGLLVSGMTNPQKVISFLDITGNWDPSLAFVMGGAVFVGIIGFIQLRNHNQSFFKDPIDFSNKIKPSLRVVIGSIVFGVGWGITGICPGPGIVNLGTGSFDALIFVIGLIIGAITYSISKMDFLNAEK